MIPNWLSLNSHKTYRMETLKIIIFLVFVLELRNLDLESYTYRTVLYMSHARYEAPILCMCNVHTCEYVFVSLCSVINVHLCINYRKLILYKNNYIYI
jgi:hypothetical protein